MKKQILLVCMLVFSSFFVFAQQDFVLSLLVDKESCGNCEEIITTLKEIKDDFTIQVLMREEMQSKKEEIVAKYALNTIADTILFSNTLYADYAMKKGSSLHIESVYKTDRYSVSTQDAIKNGFFNKIKEWNLKTNVLFKENASKAQGFVLAERNDRGEIALYIPNRKSIYIYDIFSQKLLHEIEIKEKVLKQNFTFNDAGYGIEDYDSMQSEIVHAFGSNGPGKMFFVEDTINVVLESHYAYMGENELGEETKIYTKAYGIARYVGEVFIDLYKFESSRINENNQEVISSMGFHFYNNLIYASILQSPYKKDWNHIGLLEFKDEKYQLSAKTIQSSAAVYDDYIHFSGPVFYKNAYALPVIGKIYDIKSGELIENFSFFKDTEKFIRGGMPEMLIQENGIVFNDDFVWVQLFNNRNKKIEFYKMDRESKEYELSSFNMISSANDIVFFDSFNPDYIIYKDRKANMLVRKKVF